MNEINQKLSKIDYVHLVIIYFQIFALGNLKDLLGSLFRTRNSANYLAKDGYAPLASSYESFYARRVYKRLRHAFNNIIYGVPGREMLVFEKLPNNDGSSYEFTGKLQKCINLSSYNYLGFAQSEGACADAVEQTIKSQKILTISSPRNECGTTTLHKDLEQCLAEFLGVEESICISMGFATNSTVLPALVGRDCLILSDELNHSSLVFGARLSGASIRVFKHNSLSSLEEQLREAISKGQPRTCREWKKILVVIEGLYSMEGTMINLAKVIELKRKYKFYIYLDEAHSIGAVGPNGRGVCDYHNVNPKDVDILMGTFTKSFGAAGGYIAGTRNVIGHLRSRCHAALYAEPLPIPVVQQILTSTKILMDENCGKEGMQRIKQLAENTRYLRNQLRARKFIVYGQEDSPVVPILIPLPTKFPTFWKECMARNLAVVVVGFPATPLFYSRARLCVSSALTKEDLDRAISVIDEVGDMLSIKMSKINSELSTDNK